MTPATPRALATGDQQLAHRAAASIAHPLSRTLLVLTFTTGTIDAVSYLGIGHVFTANMTGNVVFLGFGIAGSGGLPVLAPVVSLLAFLLGAGAGGRLALALAPRHVRHLVAALTAEAALVGLAALLAAVLDVRPGRLSGYVLIALLALALGVRNATVRRVAVPDLTTTVLTMTLTGLAADSPLASGSRSGGGTARRASAVATMLAGALAGALLLRDGLVAPLLLATGLTVVALLAYRQAAARGL